MKAQCQDCINLNTLNCIDVIDFALCLRCNVKVEKKDKRKYYESLFMNNLNNRRLLFWTRRMIK